ncbi:MAG: thiamine-phosphate kinase [Bacteroidota bacterium]|nr:thiamine-phosphate kinase [Bacteroidota bacterium]
MIEPTNATPISELGEFAFIRHLTENFSLKLSSSVLGVGDDAAVVKYAKRKTVISTQLFTEGVHFNLMYFPLKHLGYKAVVATISNIYAMNATPRHILVSIGISEKFSVEAVDELYSGIAAACDYYDIDLVGGDTTASVTGMVINITAVGEADKEQLIYRKGALKNDLICVTGDLGGAYMGLQLLNRENEVFKTNPNFRPQFEGYDYILHRQLKPEARKDISDIFKKLEITPTSMIDISDGLSSDIMQICKASELGCRIYEEKIPMDQTTINMGAELNMNPIVAALNGGDDFEMLFTIPIKYHDKVKNNPDITVIGHMTDASEGICLVATGGSEIPLTAQGWKE